MADSSAPSKTYTTINKCSIYGNNPVAYTKGEVATFEKKGNEGKHKAIHFFHYNHYFYRGGGREVKRLEVRQMASWIGLYKNIYND